MTDFKVQSSPLSDADALRHAADLERMIGEIVDGKRKASHLPIEPMVVLIQFARDRATHEAEALGDKRESHADQA